MPNKISFVMLTWNRCLFVEKMFESFYKKTSKQFDYEFIIIDNGSVDGTKACLSQKQLEDPKIKLFHNATNKGLSEYKRMLLKAKGDYVIIIDDDVLDFPDNFDKKLLEALTKAPDFGFIALDVIQNEFTNGAKPDISEYQDVFCQDIVLSEGPTGGWCVGFRRSDFKKIRFRFYFKTMNMKKGEDAILSGMFKKKLKLRSGILKNEKCFHACGPYYSKKYGYMNRDIEKYKISGMDDFSKEYMAFNDKKSLY